MKRTNAFFYFGHLVKMSGANTIRIVLTSIGIFTAVFLFSAGIIIANSYYDSQKSIVSKMNSNTVVVSSEQSVDTVKNELGGAFSTSAVEDMLLLERMSIFSTPISENVYFTIMANIHGITDTSKLCPIYYDGLYLPLDTKLVEGRFITSKDLTERAEVVVLDELTASILYPDESAVGKKITIYPGSGGSVAISSNGMAEKTATIIGVVENSIITDIKKLSIKKSLAKQNRESILLDVSVFCPINTLQKWFPEQEAERYLSYSFEDKKDLDSFVSMIAAKNEVKRGVGQFATYFTKEMLLENLENDLSSTRQILSAIIIVLCVISGLSIMSVTFFSVKERIPEIGIRKAFGASKVDIIFQIEFEMIIIAFLISVIAVSTSYYLCKFAENFIASSLNGFFRISIPLQQLLLPIFVGVLEAMLSSIVPSLYAASIKVTDALRFE